MITRNAFAISMSGCILLMLGVLSTLFAPEWVTLWLSGIGAAAVLVGLWAQGRQNGGRP